MAENIPPKEAAPAQVMRRMSRALSRTATFTQEITDTVNFFTDNQPIEAVLEATAPVPQAEQAPSGQLKTIAETPSQATLKQNEMNEKISEGFLHPEKIMFVDKIGFFVGVVNVCLIAYWIGRSPGNYYHFWAVKCAILFPLRWWSYKKRGWHYLMLELCYFGNFVGILQTYFYPYSVFMRKLGFAFGAGPLQWSIVAMRNSLVFHDFDKTTTLMMHASPAITVWTLRWYPTPAWTSGLTPELAKAIDNSTWLEMFFGPVMAYCLWVAFYYVTTFVLLKNRIEGQGRTTMFSLMVPKDKEAAKRSALARMVLRAPENLQPIAYLACHGLAASISFLPVKLCYDYFWLHTATLLYCLGLCIWNGGNYYFKVFAKKYLAQLDEQAKEAAKANGKTKAN